MLSTGRVFGQSDRSISGNVPDIEISAIRIDFDRSSTSVNGSSRSNAIRIAEISVHSTVLWTECPYSRPIRIVQWYRKQPGVQLVRLAEASPAGLSSAPGSNDPRLGG